jgi:hypothetical protein
VALDYANVWHRHALIGTGEWMVAAAYDHGPISHVDQLAADVVAHPVLADRESAGVDRDDREILVRVNMFAVTDCALRRLHCRILPISVSILPTL